MGSGTGLPRLLECAPLAWRPTGGAAPTGWRLQLPPPWTAALPGCGPHASRPASAARHTGFSVLRRTAPSSWPPSPGPAPTGAPAPRVGMWTTCPGCDVACGQGRGALTPSAQDSRVTAAVPSLRCPVTAWKTAGGRWRSVAVAWKEEGDQSHPRRRSATVPERRKHAA